MTPFRTPARAVRVTAAAVAVAAIGAGSGAATYAVLSPNQTTSAVATAPAHTQPVASAALTVNDIYKKAGAGTVEITVSTTADTPFGSTQGGGAQGSGFVYDTAGHIVTNQHVIDGAGSISVKLASGASYKATVVGSDPSTDLALLKIDAPAAQLHPIALANSDDVAVGDGVVAIGSPFGLTGTVTSGIVSAVDRELTSGSGFSIGDAIQTDAAINHGNSGGPLLNADAQVIGVTTQIESDSGGNDGVGFAVPSNTVKSIASQLLAGGTVKHAYLGVQVESVEGGVRVVSVSTGTPAASAGLKADDVITAVAGKTVANANELRAAIDAQKPGASVTVTYRRDGTSHTVKVTLVARPNAS
jgi:putative serine protease PepD